MIMSDRPLVLNFSGNDPTGFAGIAMDVRTQVALGVHSAAVITAVTAQNNQQVLSINAVDDRVFADQLVSIEALPIGAVKVGLIATPAQIMAIADFVKQHNISLVVDPVLNSSSGDAFFNQSLLDHYKHYLLPVCTVLTPNSDEVTLLTGLSIQSPHDICRAAAQLLAMGVNAVLIKGGHLTFGDSAVVHDYFTDGERSFWLTSEKIPVQNSRGTGCCLSSAIASSLVLGYSLYDAIVIGKMAVTQALRESYGVKGHCGPVFLNRFPDQQINLPILSNVYIESIDRPCFPETNQPRLGLYPVVDRAQWIKTLSVSGVTTIQLRVKDLQGEALDAEIALAIEWAREAGMRLFINDYWQLAIKHGAYGVHLGQEDLDVADIQQIYAAGLRLGISSHCHYEVARAHFYKPSYIACGPVFHTDTKVMPWVPHGIAGLSYWRALLEYPLVAIGGINSERINAIAASGVDSVAMITAITLADDPVATVKQFVAVCEAL
jgi:hydroxymethylpyrimidine kinase/phosphomethylpyrimidine kinase/thiamine-phosphate diphosphorylase